MGEGSAKVLSQSGADLAGKSPWCFEPGLELCCGFRESEGFQLGGPALRIFAEEDEVSGVGDQYQAILVPILTDLIALGCQPCVVVGGLDLHDTAFGELSLTRTALLNLSGGVESEVGMACALVGKLIDAENLGLEQAADGVQQVGQGRVVGTFTRGSAGGADASEVGEISLDGLGKVPSVHADIESLGTAILTLGWV